MANPIYNHAARVRNRTMLEQRSTYRGLKAMGQAEMYDKTPDYLVMQKYPKMSYVYSDYPDDRQMLLSLGVGEIGATLAIPYVRQTPRISDPDAQGVIKIVEALQRGLNRLGCRLRVDGFLGASSTHCLKQVSGVSWHDKTWLQLLGDVTGADAAGMRVQSKGALSGLGADVQTPKWETVNGVCRPSDAYTLSLFKDLQLQLNRLLYVRKKPPIDVDGRIGSQTVTAVQEIFQNREPNLIDKIMGFFGTGPVSACDSIAANAEGLRNDARTLATQQGAPMVPPTAATSKPSVVLPGGGISHPSSLPWNWIAVGAVAAGGYWYMKKHKTKKGA